VADVIGFGEAMVRLAPPDFQRLEQARSLNIEVGGAELNTLAGLARLGRSAAWVSRLTDNPLGRLVANRAREAGVATDHVLFTPDDRVGVYYLEFGAAPRASSVLYDRRDSAAARLAPGMVDWEKVFAGARWFHISGITPALSRSAAAAADEALAAARAAGLRVSLDVNYRSKLWNSEDAGRWFTAAARLSDVLLTNAEDSARFFGVRGDTPEEIAGRLGERYGCRAVAFTAREATLVWRNGWTATLWEAGQVYRTRSYEVEIVDRLGAGDAFAAGLIDGLLDDDPQGALDRATAMSALKHTVPGDFPWLTREEVEAVAGGGGLWISR
jgi:2-dehydro-3-deoxygluconokinase